MQTFGKAKGGGRRRASRPAAPLLLGTISTGADDYRVGLVNISSVGAQLTAPDLPGRGEQVIFRFEKVVSLGQIIWSDDNQCGIAFESPIPLAEVNRLRAAFPIVGLEVEAAAGV